jgi:hypothetical protein
MPTSGIDSQAFKWRGLMEAAAILGVMLDVIVLLVLGMAMLRPAARSAAKAPSLELMEAGCRPRPALNGRRR